MNENNAMPPKKGLVLKIFIPVLIIVAIAGIWIVKNASGDTGSVVAGQPDFVLTVTEPLDLDALKTHGLPILVEFGSEDCPACREMAPTIEALNAELQGKAIVKYVDVWKNPDFAKGYPLTVIPTQMFIDAEGKPYSPADPNALGMKLYQMRETEEHVFTVHEGILTKDELLGILKEMGMQ